MTDHKPHREAAPTTVFVVDDEPSVRKAIRLMLLAADHTVQEFPSAQELLEALTTKRPGCVVSDVRMPGMDGMELLQVLAGRDADLPVVMLTAHGDIPMAVNAMKIGAVEFLEKPADADDLRRKVASALARNSNLESDRNECEGIKACLSTLTPRERQVLDFLVDGKSARTISQILGSSHNTVRVQRTSIMKKMQADNITDLLKMMNQIA